MHGKATVRLAVAASGRVDTVNVVGPRAARYGETRAITVSSSSLYDT